MRSSRSSMSWKSCFRLLFVGFPNRPLSTEMRKKLIGVFLILPSVLVVLQGYFVKWEISIWMLVWVVLLAILSLSSFLKRHFGWGFIYGVLALFSLNEQFHFLPVSKSVVILSSILAVIGLNILFKPSGKAKNPFWFS